MGSLLVVRPHSKDFDCLLLVEDLIDEAMVDVNAAREIKGDILLYW